MREFRADWTTGEERMGRVGRGLCPERADNNNNSLTKTKSYKCGRM